MARRVVPENRGDQSAGYYPQGIVNSSVDEMYYTIDNALGVIGGHGQRPPRGRR